MRIKIRNRRLCAHYNRMVIAGQHRYLADHTIAHPNRRRHYWGAIELPTGQRMARIQRLSVVSGVTLATDYPDIPANCNDPF